MRRRKNVQQAVGSRDWKGDLEFIALLFTVGSLILAAANIVTLADYDLSVVPVIVHGLDFVAVAFGSLVVVATMIPAVIVGLMTDRVVRSGKMSWAKKLGLAALVILSMTITMPLAVPLITVAYWGAYGIARLLVLFYKWQLGEVRRRPQRFKRLAKIEQSILEAGHDMSVATTHFVRWYLVAVVAFLIFVLPAVGMPGWIAPEEVHVNEDTYVGWVLESGDHDLTLLEFQSRRPVILRQNDVDKRTLCSPAHGEGAVPELLEIDALRRTVWSVFEHGNYVTSRIPSCDSI